jgi:hypothetical protein
MSGFLTVGGEIVVSLMMLFGDMEGEVNWASWDVSDGAEDVTIDEQPRLHRGQWALQCSYCKASIHEHERNDRLK